MFSSNKYKLALFGILFLYHQNTAFSQDRIPYDLYFNNWQIVNPASAGLSSNHALNISYRAKNTTQNGHPSNLLISWESKLNCLKSGLGFILDNQQVGALTSMNASLLYDYQFQIGNENILSIGTNISFRSEHIDFSYFRPSDPNDPLIIINPPPSTSLDMGLGVVFKAKSWQAGMAIKNIFESEIKNPEHNFFSRNNIQHLTAFGEYKLQFNKVVFVPSIYLYTDYSDIIFDLNPTFELLNFLVLGGTLRRANDEGYFIFNAGFQWNEKIRLMGIIYSSENHGEEENFEFSLVIKMD